MNLQILIFVLQIIYPGELFVNSLFEIEIFN